MTRKVLGLGVLAISLSLWWLFVFSGSTPAQTNTRTKGTGDQATRQQQRAQIMDRISGSQISDFPRGTWTLVGWNNLGMHCMDGNDYTVFSILPPYNSIYAQLIDPSGQIVNGRSGITVTYQAMKDPDGSFNTSSYFKTDFWDYVQVLYGGSPAPDVGLAGKAMPGSANRPQAMDFDPQNSWYGAEGIPITPYDDTLKKNYYPMMALVARDSSGNLLGSTSIVLPVSDELDCQACHASGSVSAAMPVAGWVNHSDPQKDFKLNILRLHDDRQRGQATFKSALAAASYNSSGLYATVTSDHKPVLCAHCHASNALPGTGIAGIPPLTESVHFHHAAVVDPTSGLSLDQVDNRSACYRCHPGSVTKCLRGAMGSATGPDGSLLIQCQNCHGNMSAVGLKGRTGWLEEPNCQNCHTGTADKNNGQIRYVSAFVGSAPRQAVDLTFATSSDVPAPGYSLYRFSSGHGGLHCEACHGSTHAEYPSSHRNDNLESVKLQGHDGVLIECTSCHGAQPNTVNAGPHGMHPVGQSWISGHHDAVRSSGSGQCQACHGVDYRGTILSVTHADRRFSLEEGAAKQFTKGTQIGCYSCHNGPSGGD
jgi:hypothetical protein